MPFSRRRYNCCILNHPCPIFCPFINLSCNGGNEVVNPVLTTDFGFFNNTDIENVSPQSAIPLFLVQSSGNSILPSSIVGGVTLSAGTYEISYFSQGEVPLSGIINVKLTVNGVDVVGSVISRTQTVGEFTTLSQSIVVTVVQTSTLNLVNNSTDNTKYISASMVIRKL